MLDENARKKRIVGPPDLDNMSSTEPRAEIVEGNTPASRRAPGDNQQASSTSPAPIVGVEQGKLRRFIGIVDHNTARVPGDELRRLFLVQRRPGQQDRRCTLGPQVSQMRLPAARRTMHYEWAGGPIGPSLYPGHCRGVAVGDKEIRTPECGAAV